MLRRTLEQTRTIIKSMRRRAFDLIASDSVALDPVRDRHINGGSAQGNGLPAEGNVAGWSVSEFVGDEKKGSSRTVLHRLAAKDDLAAKDHAEATAFVAHAGVDYAQSGGIICVRSCGFSDHQLFRRFHPPASIGFKKVTAPINKGILQRTALKATAGQMTAAA